MSVVLPSPSEPALDPPSGPQLSALAAALPRGGFLRLHGRALVDQGYSIVPIKPGTKAPMIAGWQKRDFNSEDLSRKFNGHGVGVKTGVLNAGGHAVVGVDLDISDPAMVELMEAWCRENIGVAPVRIGRPPRAMLVYRTWKTFRKKRSLSYRSPDGVDQGIEVLCTGNQFVAYAIHPSTGNPYIWPNSDLVDIPVKDLPEITEAQALALCAYFEANLPPDWRLLTVDKSGKLIGLGEDNGHRTGADPDADPEELAAALAVIPIPPDDPRSPWIKIGMALHHATDGSREGLALWDHRSLSGEKYKLGEPERLWKGFTGYPADRMVGAGTIFQMADEADPSWRERFRANKRTADSSLVGRLSEQLSRLGAKVPSTVGAGEPAFDEAEEDEDSSDTQGDIGIAPLEPVSLASLYGIPAPPQRWIVDALIPDRTVTDLSGDGGVGKSLLALQLGIAVVTGAGWLGRDVAAGGVLYLSCEDELSTIQRRAEAIVASEGRTLADLTELRILDLTVGIATELAVAGREGAIQMTALFDRLRLLVAEYGPKLIVLDTRADVFAGNEIDRVQVRTFIRHLRELCLSKDMAILLLSHPSRAGLTTGDGQSGSTAWGNSVRSRLNLISDPDDPDRRVLKALKANYGPAAAEIALRFENGAFRLAGVLVEGRPLDRSVQERMVEERFLKHLVDADLRGEYVNDAPTGPHYAPKFFAKFDGSGPERIGKKPYEDAMWRLRHKGLIKLVPFGSQSKNWRKFVAVDPSAPLKLLTEQRGQSEQGRAAKAVPSGI